MYNNKKLKSLKSEWWRWREEGSEGGRETKRIYNSRKNKNKFENQNITKYKISKFHKVYMQHVAICFFCFFLIQAGEVNNWAVCVKMINKNIKYA